MEPNSSKPTCVVIHNPHIHLPASTDQVHRPCKTVEHANNTCQQNIWSSRMSNFVEQQHSALSNMTVVT